LDTTAVVLGAEFKLGGFLALARRPSTEQYCLESAVLKCNPGAVNHEE
jgi:hypothetical protein